VTTLAEKIDALLPQTQCTKCGYAGCMPYAEAIAANEAPIDRCPPGGDAGIVKLAALLGKSVVALDITCGEHAPHRVALIDENVCIGCAKCLKPCPTDAIVGANKFMHTVIASLCTGCELCIPPCPVDCITMVEDRRFPSLPDADFARERFRFHNFRLARDERERADALAAKERAVLKK
jgi:electron transport complex protein RnfB